jgi:hypothetical protein
MQMHFLLSIHQDASYKVAGGERGGFREVCEIGNDIHDDDKKGDSFQWRSISEQRGIVEVFVLSGIPFAAVPF